MSKLLTTSFCVLMSLATAVQAQDDIWDLVLVAKKNLASLQRGSFENNREYCGMIGRTSAGELIASPARRGSANGCNARGFTDRSIVPVASYHTHGGFQANADSEVPSVSDMNMDVAQKVIGFVATPGGRFWMVDYRTKTIKQICGIGCLPKDPQFVEGMAGPIPIRMTRAEMKQRQNAGGPKVLRSRYALKN